MTNLGRHFSVCTHEHGFSSRILGIGDGQFSELCWVHGLCGLKVNSANLNNACWLRDCVIIFNLEGRTPLNCQFWKSIGVPKFNRELGRVSNFNQSINWHHHIKVMSRLIIWPRMMLLGWTETKLWTLKYGSKSIQMSLILRQCPPKRYKLLNFFHDFRDTL